MGIFALNLYFFFLKLYFEQRKDFCVAFSALRPFSLELSKSTIQQYFRFFTIGDSCDLGKPSKKYTSFFWALSKSGLDAPPPLILDICGVTFLLAHFGQL